MFDFEVRGRNSQGGWSTAAHTVQIRVVPPFWMTTWFRVAMVLLVVAAAILGHRVRTERLKQRNRELLELHEQRDNGSEHSVLRTLIRIYSMN